MAYQIVWSAEAENDFKNIILYLKENWSVLSAEKFVLQTYKRLENLAAMPTAARPTTQELIYMHKLDRKDAGVFCRCCVFMLMVLQLSNHQQPAMRYELRISKTIFLLNRLAILK